MRQVATASITAQNTFTDAVLLQGLFNLVISGTWTGTVTFQTSFDGGSTWVDSDTFTANIHEIGDVAEDDTAIYRCGVKTGEYGSGTVGIRISQ